MLISLMAGVVLVLVIACVNTAQLLLAQLQIAAARACHSRGAWRALHAGLPVK